MDFVQFSQRVDNSGGNRSKVVSLQSRDQPWSTASWGDGDQCDGGFQDIIARLSSVFEDIKEYKCLLTCRDQPAQSLLDLFQMVCKHFL